MALFDGVNLNDYEEPTLLADGTEVEFKIVDAEPKKSEKATWMQLVIQPINTEETNPSIVYHNLFLPLATDDRKIKNMRLGQITKLCKCLAYVPEDGVPKREEFLGKIGRAVLKIQRDDGFEPRNQIRRVIKAE